MLRIGRGGTVLVKVVTRVSTYYVLIISTEA